MQSRKQHPAELRERAVAMVFELRAASGSSRGTLASVGQKLGVNPETLRNWVEKAEIDSGQRPGTTSDDKKRIAELEKEVRELRRANERPRRRRALISPGNSTPDFRASRVHRFAQGPVRSGAGRARSGAVSTVGTLLCGEEERGEPVRAGRARRGAEESNHAGKGKRRGRKLYGAKKMWRELNRDGIEVARCTVERLMREMGLEGLRPRKKRPRTTVPGPAGQERPSDLLERDFTAPAPNRRWVADITYIETSVGFVYAAIHPRPVFPDDCRLAGF